MDLNWQKEKRKNRWRCAGHLKKKEMGLRLSNGLPGTAQTGGNGGALLGPGVTFPKPRNGGDGLTGIACFFFARHCRS